MMLFGLLLALSTQLPQADSGAFVVTLGKDTLGVERYVRTKLTHTSQLAYRVPQTRAFTLSVTYDDKGRLSWYELIDNRVAGVPKAYPQMRSLVMLRKDSAMVQSWVDAEAQSPKSFKAAPDVRFIGIPFFSTLEAAMLRVRERSDTGTVNSLGSGGALPYFVQWFGRDSVNATIPGSGRVRAKFNRAGEMTSLDATESTFKVRVSRITLTNLDKYFRRFATADSLGKSLGPLSPNEVLEEAIGATSFRIIYGRPAMHGRVIFGGVVPFGKVWRTGANAATQFEIEDYPLFINGVQIPVGKYSLWTIPDRTGWLLIVNKHTKQWGTMYDEKEDLVRIPIKVAKLVKPVDRFTIEYKAITAEEGVLTFSWADTKASATLRSKNVTSKN